MTLTSPGPLVFDSSHCAWWELTLDLGARRHG